MGLYTTNPDLGGYVHADAPELDRKLREGDGLLWQGDRSLELRMGILTAKRTGFHPQVRRHVQKGEVLARRYEVWTHTPDGADEMLGHWLLEEFDRILFDLSGMRMDAPGHVDTGETVDANNDAVTAAAGEEYAQHYGEAAEHMAKLVHDRTNPKNVFRGIPGRRDEAKVNVTDRAVKITDKRASADASV